MFLSFPVWIGAMWPNSECISVCVWSCSSELRHVQHDLPSQCKKIRDYSVGVCVLMCIRVSEAAGFSFGEWYIRKNFVDFNKWILDVTFIVFQVLIYS